MSKSILRELAKRERAARLQTPESIANKIVRGLTEVQKRFVFDKHRLKVARCGRRAGKSHADAAYMIIEALIKPKANVLYLGITQSSAFDIMWRPLVDMLHLHKIVHRPIPSSKTIFFPNGSKIKLFGADSQNAKDRLRGVAFDLVVVDECGFVAEVDELVDIVLPSLADYGGTLCLTSSPPEVMKGMFYEADVGNARDLWAQYSWTMLDNPHFQAPAKNPKYKNRAEEEMALVLHMKYGGNSAHPTYRREWFGEWVVDASALLYPITDRNRIPAQKYPIDTEYYVGADFGVASASAISVIAMVPGSNHLDVVYTWKQVGCTVDDLGAQFKKVIAKYNPVSIVGDAGGLGKVFIHELVRNHGLPIRNAEKSDKLTAQRLVADDLLSGYLRITVPECQDLAKEYATLARGDDGKEEKKQDNHLADATLYAYRSARVAIPLPKAPVENEEETMLRSLMAQMAYEHEERDNLGI